MRELPRENVLDFPRPAVCEPCPHLLEIAFGGRTIASTCDGWRVLETYHPPTYYLPREAFAEGVLIANGRRSLCEWKGQAGYFDIAAGGRTAGSAAWSYERPTPPFAPIKGMVAVYAEPMDACRVAGVDVVAQPGNFYGGWVTPNITGPVKGAPGTTHW